jgi:hypothetical protein
LIRPSPTPIAIACDPQWCEFWNQYAIPLTSTPIVGLINSAEDKRPSSLVVFTGKSILFIANLRVTQAPNELEFSSDQNTFKLNGQPTSFAETAKFLSKLIETLSNFRVAWFRLIPKTRATLGRNLYWDKIASSLTQRIHFEGDCEIGPAGIPLHVINQGVLTGLVKLKSYATFGSESGISMSWIEMMQGISPLESVTAAGLTQDLFTKSTQASVATGTIDILGRKLPLDVIYDLYCELTNTSIHKQFLAKFEARYFGIVNSNSDGERQFYWRDMNLTFDTFCTHLRHSVTALATDLSLATFQVLGQRIQSIPIRLIEVAPPTVRKQFQSELISLNKTVAGLLSFVEWNSELFLDIRSVKQILSRSLELTETYLRQIQNLEVAADIVVSQLESTRSRLQFSLNLICEKLTGVNSQQTLQDLSDLIGKIELLFDPSPSSRRT